MSRLIAGAQCWARDSYGGVFQGAPVPTSPDLSTRSLRMKKEQRLPLLRNVFYLHSVYLHKLVSERNNISLQRIEDGLKKTTGSIKEKAGKVLGGRRLEVEARRRKPRAMSGAGSERLWTWFGRLSRTRRGKNARWEPFFCRKNLTTALLPGV